jgi:hypothetical protein
MPELLHAVLLPLTRGGMVSPLSQTRLSETLGIDEWLRDARVVALLAKHNGLKEDLESEIEAVFDVKSIHVDRLSHLGLEAQLRHRLPIGTLPFPFRKHGFALVAHDLAYSRIIEPRLARRFPFQLYGVTLVTKDLDHSSLITVDALKQVNLDAFEELATLEVRSLPREQRSYHGLEEATREILHLLRDAEREQQDVFMYSV